ncbi:unnamed protein product, partial [Prorocentrum cordatum]
MASNSVAASQPAGSQRVARRKSRRPQRATPAASERSHTDTPEGKRTKTLDEDGCDGDVLVDGLGAAGLIYPLQARDPWDAANKPGESDNNVGGTATPVAPDPNVFVCRFEMEALVAVLKLDFLSSVINTSSALATQLADKTASCLRKFAAQQEAKHEETALRLRELNQRQTSLEQAHSKMAAEVDRLKHTLHLCEQAAPQSDYADVAGFAREPSRTCFVASAKAAVSSSSVKEAVLPWLEAAGFKDDQWQARLGWLRRTPSTRIKALKLPDGGGWRKFETRDAEPQVQELFISLVKNGQQIRREAPSELKAPLSFATWNARALLHHDLRIRQHKMKYLSQFLSKGTILALQEVHATELELQQDLFKLHIPHLAFSSFGAQRNTGGVAIITPCSQSGVHQRAKFWHEELVPGRIERLRISSISHDTCPSVSTVIYNVHNYNISRQQAQSLRQRVARDVALANTAPD